MDSGSADTRGLRSGGSGAFTNQILPMAFQTLPQLLRLSAAGGGARRDHDVQSRQHVLVQPEALANQPPQAIACDGGPDRAHAHRHSEPGKVQTVGAKRDSEIVVPRTSTLLVKLIELRAGANSLAGTERQTPDRGSVRAMRLRESDACGPLHGAARERVGRLCSPCARENRACVCDGSCSAGRCAS